MGTKLLQTNFTGGEQTPRLSYRVDVDKRANNGVKEAINTVIYIHGGARSTYGREWVNNAMVNSGNQELFEFRYSETEALMIEIAATKFRFYDQDKAQIQDGGSAYEVTHVYTSAQIPNLNIISRKNTILFFHPDVPVKRLRRFSNTNWVFDDFPFEQPPVSETGFSPGFNVTLSALTGSGITVTCGQAIFRESDVGRTLTSDAGELIFTAHTNDNTMTADVVSDFASSPLAAASVVFDGSPQTTITPTSNPDVGSEVTINTTLDCFREVTSTYTDIGAIISINGGFIKITEIVTANQIKGIVTQKMTAAVASPANAWSILYPIYSEVLGYPRAGIFFRQRLILCGSNGFPNSFAASRIGITNDFTLGDLDDDGFLYETDLDQNNPIINVGRRKKGFLMFTSGEEVFLGPDENGLFTPTALEIDNVSEYGSARVPPIRAASDLIYLQSGSRKLRAARYSLVDDEFDSDDITKLCEHITESGVVSMAYQREPDSILWLVLANGDAVTVTLDRREGIIAATKIKSNGDFKAVATMDDTNGQSQVWFLVDQTIDGAVVRHIESEDPELPDVEAGITITAGSAQTSWTGLDHLAGETVAMTLDGIILKDAAVDASGNLTTTKSGTVLKAGLEYTDKPQVSLWPAHFSNDAGTIMGDKSRLINGTVGLLDSGPVYLNNELQKSEQYDTQILDTAPPKLTGDFKIPQSGYNINNPFLIIAATIEPIHVLGAVRNIDLNNRDR